MLAAREVTRAPAWLRYANQNATRRLPLNSKLIGALGSFLPELGVTMEVFSGGQHTAAEVAEARKRGENLSRTGSVRHDHGGAADAFFYKDGRRLDWANPKDRPIFEEIVRRGRAAGLTGFGAGDGYMQPGSMHLGFGGEGVWGAGGSGKNAAGWLRAAYGGAPAGSAPDVTAEPAVTGPADRARVMLAGGVQEVTEPDILKAFGKDIGVTPTNMPTAADVVVDPIRPARAGERRDNPDGSYSTELSTTWQLPDGQWVNVPSLWRKGDQWQQFEPGDEQGILGAMQAYEAANGPTFARFGSLEEAERAAEARSAAGGAGAGVAEVTDPAIRKAFEQGQEAAPIDPASIQSDPDRTVGLGGMFKYGFTSDIDEEIRNAAQSIYPNEPLEEAAKRFSLVDGELVHRADDGKIYRAYETGLSGALGWGAGMVGQALPITAGVTTGILTAPMSMTGVGLPVSMALTGAAGAAGEFGRQALGDVMLGDASTNSLDVGKIVTEGATNALGQGIGAGIGHLATRNAVRDIDRLNRTQTLRAYEEAKKKGIDVTPGEATGLPSLRSQQQLLANDFRTADQMQDFYSTRNTQVMKAWDDFLGGISQAADGEDVAMSVRTAAKGVIDDAIAARQKAAAPLYDKAFKTTIPFTDKLKELSERPVIKKAMAKAFELMDNAGKDPTQLFEMAENGSVILKRVPSVEEWQFVKFGLDDLIDGAKNTQTGKLTSEGRIYTQIKRDLLDEIDSLVPEYGQARRLYESGSENVNGALESAIKRMADIKDPDILRETRTLFEPGMRSPQMVRRLGKSIAEKDPQAWQAVKRLYLHDEATRALKATEVGEIRNPAGKIWKTFANEKVLGNIEAALAPEELESFKSLMKVYRVIGGAQERNSWTAFMQEMQRETARNARPAWAKVVKNINPAELLRSVDAWATERNLTKHAETMVELITSGDPAVISKLKELRQLSPNSKRGVVLFGQLLAETTAFGVGSLLAPQNYDPNKQPN
jgi:hypothetical protein